MNFCHAAPNEVMNYTAVNKVRHESTGGHFGGKSLGQPAAPLDCLGARLPTSSSQVRVPMLKQTTAHALGPAQYQYEELSLASEEPSHTQARPVGRVFVLMIVLTVVVADYLLWLLVGAPGPPLRDKPCVLSDDEWRRRGNPSNPCTYLSKGSGQSGLDR